MAAAPTYAVTPRVGTLISTSGDTAGTATAAIVAGGASGSDVLGVRVVVGPLPSPGGGTYVDVVIDDGSTKTVVDNFSMVGVKAGQVVYANANPGWLLPSASYSLKLIHRTTLTVGSTLHVTAMVKDY